MDTTQNFGLKKPGADDFVDIDVLNENMDIIDEKCARESWYGTCPTSYSTTAKVVTTQTGNFKLKAGHRVKVKFTNYNTASSPTLNVDNTGAKYIKQYGTVAPLTYTWYSGEVVEFVYDGTYFIIADGGVASTTYYGVTKLSSSTTSTAQNLAATPYAVKQANDRANSAYNYADEAYVLAEDAVPQTRKINGQTLDKDIILDGIALKTIEGAGCKIGSSVYPHSAAYAGEKFIIAAGTNTFCSNDGINWAKANTPPGMSVAGAAYGDGIFVLTGYDSNLAAYSTDGSNWTQTTMPHSGRWESVVFGGGIFVAADSLPSGTRYIAYSTDGISWAEGTVDLKHIAFGNGMFVGTQYYTSSAYKPFYYSYDGINWANSTSSGLADLQILDIAYGADKFIAVGTTSLFNAQYFYSSNGTSWSARALPKEYGYHRLCSITYGAGKFMAVAGTDAEYSFSSSDGFSWNKSYLPLDLNPNKERGWRSIVFGDDLFIAVPYYGNNIPYSNDGINWLRNGLNLVDSKSKGILNDIREALHIKPTKIYKGTYTGTGTYGDYYGKSSLRLSSIPKCVIISPRKTGMFPKLIIINAGEQGWYSVYYNFTYSTQKEIQACWTTQGLDWYSADSAQYQLNVSGTVYEYYVIE